MEVVVNAMEKSTDSILAVARQRRAGYRRAEETGTGSFQTGCPDFRYLEFSFDILASRLRELAFLNRV